MTASNVAATQVVVDNFLTARFPWLPLPKIVEWDNTAGGSTYYTGTAGATISVPKYSDAWNDGRADIDIHECGHVLCFYITSLGVRVLENFLTEFGGSVDLLADRSRLNEVFAEHFVRAYLPTYDGHNRPDLIGKVAFDAAKMRAFCEALKPVVPAGAVAAPPTSQTPAGPTIRDVRAQLPFDAANLPWPITSPKTSSTVHWPGGEFDVQTDDDALNLIWAFAEEHINKDWAPQIPGAQGGAGLMYAEVIAPSGTVFLTRDPDANLWHSNDAVGNSTSRPILVICGNDRPPTKAQLRSLRSRIVGQAAFPHSIWTQTQCPGDALRAFLAGDMAVEGEDVAFTDDPAAVAYRQDVRDTFEAIKAVLAQLATTNKVEDAQLADVTARIDKLHAI